MVVGIVPLLCMTCSMVENCVCMAWRCLSCVACRRPPPSNGMCFFRADRLTFCNKSTLAAAQQKGGWRLAFKFKLASDRRTELCEEAGASTARINHTEVGVNQRSRQNIYIYMFGTIKKGYFNDGQQAEHDILFVLSYVRIYVRSFVRTCSYIVDECAVYRFPWISIGQFLSEYCQPMLYGHWTNHQHILYCVLQIVSPHSIHIHRRRRPNQQQKKQ